MFAGACLVHVVAAGHEAVEREVTQAERAAALAG